jgi:hypothetical protein
MNNMHLFDPETAAALEELKSILEKQGVVIRTGIPRQKMTNLEREVIDMEVMLRSAWLLVIKAVWMADNKRANSKEASMCKVRAGDIVTKITQRAVELLGPLGYSREYLLEKWFRDAKISDIYEGTGQINPSSWRATSWVYRPRPGFLWSPLESRERRACLNLAHNNAHVLNI